MQAISEKVDALFNELGRQYEVLQYEEGRRDNVNARRSMGRTDTRLDELLTIRRKIIERAMGDVVRIKSDISKYNSI